ncbi:MAG: ATP-grasp domain-containing protein, partial [Candidatus Omnitrophica bacterium]|nr:ATP-grasp domain-containing protein [Candidatus Omnitrophota bacterium]
MVGPEAPLALGIVDEFQKLRLPIFGPKKSAANLEASKVFAKQLMAKYRVPTAGFGIFDNAQEASRFIEKKGAPCVVKADGLAAGKGVVVAKTVDEAKQAVSSMMRERIFGDAGNRVIVEDCLEGQEASILVFTDSREVVPSVVTQNLFQEIIDKIINRTIDGLAKEGIEYAGVLYAGVMLTKDGPKVLEFNVRFGDPETEAILPRLESDLLEVMLATAGGKLSNVVRAGGLKWDTRACVCVVCASSGYPGEYERGKEILGLELAEKMNNIVVFHAGTRRLKDPRTQDSKILTSGGRVLGVTGLGNSIG